MDQTEFITQFRKDKDMYAVWGNHVKDLVKEKLNEKGVEYSVLSKIEFKPRVKDETSLLEKAFYRNKNYANPYNNITDKVGIRFVVLLENDIHTICSAIEDISIWDASLDKDYDKEKLEKPELFDYKSMHYIVYNKKEIRVCDTIIRKSTPCEIQVRTLLQHAYAEMSHDQIYKNKNKIEPEVKRLIARSMALIEATDQYFIEASERINESNMKYKTTLDRLNEIYKNYVNRSCTNIKVNLSILDDLNEFLDDFDFQKLIEYLTVNKYIGERIVEQYENYLLFREPVVLLLFYLLDNNQSELLSKWPVVPDYLVPISSILGICLE